MSVISIQKVNEVYNRIHCEGWLKKELDQFFTFKVPGYQFTPQYRSGIWNGEIHLLNMKTSLLYGGLNHYIEKFASERGYEVEYLSDFGLTSYSLNEANKFIKELGPALTPRDYQVEAFCHAVRSSRALLLSPTASGKSFIIYLIIRYFNQRTLLIVPTTSLVLQMASDFKDYGMDVEEYVHKIYSGKEKDSNKQIVVTTWQSIYKMPKDWFKKFNVVIGDEAHLFKAKSLTAILTNLDHCKYRFGFTGTLDGTHTHRLVLEGLFGAVKNVTTTHELIKQKHLSQFRIKSIVLKHDEANRKLMHEKTYQEEIDYLIAKDKRNNFIKNLALSLKGNTLLLFQHVEKHGKILYKMIEDARGDKTVFFVHGGVDGEDREDIRRLVEMDNNTIIVASYGTLSTGVNIKNLHNIIFASPSKSRIRNLQSIGRGLRLGDNKTSCTLFDIADDLQWKNKKNFTLKHFIDRMKIYNEEKFDTQIYQVNLI